MKGNFSEQETNTTPDWKYRWGLRAGAALMALGGIAGMRNFLSGELTAAGHEVVPWIAASFFAVGVLGLGASFLK